MTILFQDRHDLSPEDLQALFLSVKWSSGHYPDRLAVAMQNFKTVYTAWDGSKLVGLICAMDDGVMTAYIHYLLVNPDYQYKGIGKELIEHVLKTYQSYLRISLIANGNNVGFYENCEFKIDKTGIPMHITSLLK